MVAHSLTRRPSAVLPLPASPVVELGLLALHGYFDLIRFELALLTALVDVDDTDDADDGPARS